MSISVVHESLVAGVVVGESALRVWTLKSTERLRRQLRLAGVSDETTHAARILLLRADWVYDDRLIRGLVAQVEPCGLWTPQGQCVAIVAHRSQLEEARASLAMGLAPTGLRRLLPEHVTGGYDDKLRKREHPFLLPLAKEEISSIEARIFAGSYKGVTDFVTLSWPPLVKVVTRACARLGVTPNMVTSVSLVLVVLATWLFWNGRYELGLFAAWLMAFLDSVDGKLARVTLKYSRFGDIFDHSIDLVHPPFWWWAWIAGLPVAGFTLPMASLVLTVILVGYVAQRLEEGIFIKAFGMDMHVWRRFDSRLRLVTARRNPNLAILTVAVVLGRPEWGIAVVALWVAICLVVHAVRIAQAAIARRDGPLVSWLERS